MRALIVHRYEVRIIRFQVLPRIYVLDGEAESLRQLRKSHHVFRVVEELGKLPLKIVVTRHQIKDALLAFPYRTRPRKGLATRKHTRRLEQLWCQLLNRQFE